jgi:hypothetical protein
MQDFEAARRFIDKTISMMPEFENFNISAFILKLNIPKDERELANNNDAIEILLIRTKLVEYSNTTFYIRLTDLGRQVRKVGSLSEYEKKKEQDNDLNNRIKVLQEKNLTLSNEFSKLQIKESKTKKLWAVIGFGSGTIFVYALDNWQSILAQIKLWLHR